METLKDFSKMEAFFVILSLLACLSVGVFIGKRVERYENENYIQDVIDRYGDKHCKEKKYDENFEYIFNSEE